MRRRSRPGEIDDVEVVVADEGDALPVGAERRLLFLARRGRQPRRRAARERVEVEIVRDVEHDRALLRIERRAPPTRSGLFAVIRSQSRCLERRLQLRAVEQRPLFAGGDVEEPPLDELPFFVLLRPEEGRVVDPVEPALDRAAEVDLRRRVVDRLEGDLLFLAKSGVARRRRRAGRFMREGIMAAGL